jgi:hypothetical protein
VASTLPEPDARERLTRLRDFSRGQRGAIYARLQDDAVRIDTGLTGLIFDGRLVSQARKLQLLGTVRFTRLTQVALASWFAALLAMGLAIPLSVIPDIAASESNRGGLLFFLFAAFSMWLGFSFLAVRFLRWGRSMGEKHLRRVLTAALAEPAVQQGNGADVP